MASKIPDLIATARTGTGKGAARQTRRAGHVPGIVYGGGADPLPISLPFNLLLKNLRAGRFRQTLFNLKVEGQDDVRVICRAIERDPVKDLPIHVDFLRLRQTTRINLFIHVNFENHHEAPGLREGGVLTVVRPEVELDVLAGEIPEQINVDLTGLQIGDVIHIHDVKLPAGTRATTDRNFVVANISAPSGLRAADEDEDAAEDAEGGVEEESAAEE